MLTTEVAEPVTRAEMPPIAANTLLDALAGRSLGFTESYDTFTALIAGEFSDVEIAGLLVALKTRGETAEEIAGAARALRQAALPFPKPSYRVADTCGTGGDGAGTINISTAAAFVAAEAGIPVAKHGNRAVSSRCGSADVLEAAGVKLEPDPAVARRCLDEVGLCFLFAPQYHPGMRRASPVRRALKTRTLFNILGPLVNPARPERQVLGVYSERFLRPAAQTLARLGCEDALVVHGSGLDEIALHGRTKVAHLSRGKIDEFELTPEEFGLPRFARGALEGAEPAAAGLWLRELLAGRGAPAHTAAVAANAGALLWIAGKAHSLAQGVAQALAILGSGLALHRLDLLIEVSHAT